MMDSFKPDDVFSCIDDVRRSYASRYLSSSVFDFEHELYSYALRVIDDVCLALNSYFYPEHSIYDDDEEGVGDG